MQKVQKSAFSLLQKIHDISFQQRILLWTPRCRIVLFTQLQISHFFPGSLEELLHNLYPLCFTYQQVECLYTQLNYPFLGKIVVKSSQVPGIVQRATYFNQRNRGMDGIPSTANRRHMEKFMERVFSDFSK